ncbi:MAG TPA: serine hydrolase domain-containing protein [Opitutaceae bacterium]|nr:serine hydrolase domain-containing protein [Opitutaceae bacterium]
MKFVSWGVFLVLSVIVLGVARAASETPQLPGVSERMQRFIDAREVAGAVTVVVDRDGYQHFATHGYADLETQRVMRADTLFWIASMSKPVTAAAVLRLQDEGKLNVNDLVERYLPEFASLTTPSGQPARLTLAQLLSHTSGLAESSGQSAVKAVTLADLIPQFVASPTLFEPGTRWKYSQSSINTAARIVEVVSGRPFDVYLNEQFFGPLGMKDTTFYPTAEQRARLVTAYRKDAATNELKASPPRIDIHVRERPPLGNGGLFSTAQDYARFCRMLLNEGSLEGRNYLKPETVRQMRTIVTGDLVAGFLPGAPGHGWGLGCGVVREPQGVTAMLSPGTFGHGGAWGTQAWIDPVKGVAYLLMVQRTNFGNSDASEVRKGFQEAAASALTPLSGKN